MGVGVVGVGVVGRGRVRVGVRVGVRVTGGELVGLLRGKGEIGGKETYLASSREGGR